MDRSQDPLADEERLRPHEVQVEGERLQPGALLELPRHAVLRLGLGEVRFLVRIQISQCTMKRVTEQLLHSVVIEV